MPAVKKNGPWFMGEYIPSELVISSAGWCLNNGIKVYPIPKRAAEWFIEIDISGKVNRSPYVYTKDNVWEKIHEYYKYYYKKYYNEKQI